MQGAGQESLLCPWQKDPGSRLHFPKGRKRNDPQRETVGNDGCNGEQMQGTSNWGIYFMPLLSALPGE